MTDTDQFEAILKALDIEDLSEKEQEEILLDLNDLIMRGSMVRLIERMDEKTRDDFAVLMDRDAPQEEIEAFLAERVPGAEAAVAETIADLRDDILAVTTS